MKSEFFGRDCTTSAVLYDNLLFFIQENEHIFYLVLTWYMILQKGTTTTGKLCPAIDIPNKTRLPHIMTQQKSRLSKNNPELREVPGSSGTNAFLTFRRAGSIL
jgi:hypothetical protein